MKKRILSLLLVFVLLCGTWSIASVSAYSETDIAYPVEGGNIYFDKETGTITDCDNAVTRADIPAEIDGVAVTSIGAYAFYGSAITGIEIPDSVITIGECAFISCGALKHITIGKNVASIGEGAFSECWKLEEIIVDESNNIYSNDANGVLFDKEKTEVLRMPCGFSGEYEIPKSVKSVGKDSFYYCKNLTNVTIPNSVTDIGGGAFAGCKGLTTITIPDSVISVGADAFYACNYLSSVTIGKSVSNIGAHAFCGCWKLTALLLPESVKSIGNRAFMSCSSLHAIYFMGNAPELGEDVFDSAGAEEGLTLYFIESKEGWTSPTWNGYPTATWVPVHEHSYADTVTAPTCTEKGYTTHTCECGESYADTYVDALGHDFGLWTQTKAPTCTEKGEEKRTCSRCEALETRELAALEHSYENGACVRCGEKDPNAQEPVTFTDVPKDEWYVGAVEYAVQNGLMNGVGDGKFAPEGSMTRAMLVTVLWRYEGAPETGKNPFTDVPNGQWYTDAVAWAAANGIVGGVGNNKFDPEGKITREQMATILYRYAEKKGIDTGKRGDLSAFPDGGKVASWAKNAVQWAVAEKIINGSDGKLLPQGDATRAQVATILMRFIENIVKK